MTDYSASTEVQVEAKKLFAYLSDPTNLPDYFPRVTSAQRTDGDKVDVTARIQTSDGETRDVQGEAWLRVESADTSLTWGAPGPNNYQGRLDLDPHDDGSCALSVTISSDRGEPDQVQQGVDEAVVGVKDAAERYHA